MANTRAGGPNPRKARELRPIVLIAALCGIASLGLPRVVAPQAISTATIRGTARSETGASVDGASVRVLNTATGVALHTQVRRGRFFVHGLDVGGPYVVEVRHIGFRPQQSGPLFLTLGEPVDVQFVLQPLAIQLDRVVVTGAETSRGGGGTATIIQDSVLYRLPTMNRSFLDFVQLTPQVSTKIGFQRSGMSAAGANLRFNNYLINGADERYVFSNISPGLAGRSIPIDAVKEYQVLVAPYDVRYGEFAGALVNTVTQSGTNELRGSTFAYWRTNQMARGGDRAPDSLRYERLQFGFSLGGPILRNRIHFFVAPEFERLTSPLTGPYVGQPPTLTPRAPVTEAQIDRFTSIMRAHGLTAGSGGFMEVDKPLDNLFARLDVALPRWNSRVLGFLTYTNGRGSELSRTESDFSLSSSTQIGGNRLRLTSVQLHTDLGRVGGGHNELLVSHSSDRGGQYPTVRQPLVHVLVPSTNGKTVWLSAGATDAAQAGLRRGLAIKVKDELTLPWGASHVLVLGVQADRFRLQPAGVRGSYGTWTFSSLDSLASGLADQFELKQDLGGALRALRGGQYAAYVGDDWRAAERLSLTLGVRADLLDLSGHAPYNAAVDSIFGRRTDEMPRERVHISPRMGFTWSLDAARRDRLRGGVGIFSGRPPLGWLHPALVNHGVGIGVLSCGSSFDDDGAPPAFQPDYRKPPTACATASSLTPAKGGVDLLDRNLRMAQALRASLAYDRRLPWGLGTTIEVLATQYLSDFRFVNLNLEEPKGVDRFGRVMYERIGGSGVPDPMVRSTRFTEVIDLRNTSKNYSHQLSTRIEKQFSRGISATAHYTYSRTRDVESPSRIGSTGIALWGDARPESGRHEDVVRGIALNDLPHRAVAALSYTAPWKRWSTGFSFYYVGESGSPFTFLAGGVGKRGDLNADGSNINDPIYVPRSAFDTAEIRFDGESLAGGADNSPAARLVREREQQSAFDAFVSRTPCLRRQRGRIMERNSCREPFSHTTIASVRQAVPIGGRALEAELDVFNVLNLLNARWGHYRVAAPRVLEHVKQTAGTVETSQPIFRFDTTRPDWTTLRTESAFQLQLALRYRF